MRTPKGRAKVGGRSGETDEISFCWFEVWVATCTGELCSRDSSEMQTETGLHT